MPTALTIAGSDSGGGAGIQADLKTFAALGVYGTSAIAAVTAQNTERVMGVHLLPPAFVVQQIDAVASDITIDAVKTGMLGTAAIVDAVAGALERWSLPCANGCSRWPPSSRQTAWRPKRCSAPA